MFKIVTKSEKQTFNLGKKLAKKLRDKKIITLTGELGTGKTVFVKGLAAGLGIKKYITSPTFVLFKNYRVKSQKSSPDEQDRTRLSKIRNLCHIDAYRIKDPQELIEVGVLDYFNQPDTVCVIEWADKVKKILPRKRINIFFEHGKKENERIIKISDDILI